ncbi:hypothetical protein JHK87_040343 [Glycine soja]|nr:hypothetical protein JHK87_040343 [Glycine soja]
MLPKFIIGPFRVESQEGKHVNKRRKHVRSFESTNMDVGLRLLPQITSLNTTSNVLLKSAVRKANQRFIPQDLCFLKTCNLCNKKLSPYKDIYMYSLNLDAIQYRSYTDYTLDRGLIKKADYDSINKLIPPCKQAIEACVYSAMMQDWMRNLEVGIPTLLEEGIKVLMYAGEEDLICNWLGNSRWVNAMEWSGQKQFGASSTVPFLVDGVEAGTLKSHGPLAFLKARPLLGSENQKESYGKNNNEYVWIARSMSGANKKMIEALAARKKEQYLKKEEYLQQFKMNCHKFHFQSFHPIYACFQ